MTESTPGKVFRLKTPFLECILAVLSLVQRRFASSNPLFSTGVRTMGGPSKALTNTPNHVRKSMEYFSSFGAGESSKVPTFLKGQYDKFTFGLAGGLIFVFGLPYAWSGFTDLHEGKNKKL